MPCLLALLALLTPRLVVFLLWLAHWFRGTVAGLWVLLGFIFLPTTLLWYTFVQKYYAGEWTVVPVVGLVIALLVDVSPAKRRRRNR